MRERIRWIDVAKFFGIFSIYVGHFGAAAGNAYNFVFSFHVPLFFFLAGCTETLSREKHLGRYVWKKVKAVLLPFFMFVVLSLLLFTFMYQEFTLMDVLINLYWGMVKGAIRNQFFAGSIWFLSCYFVVVVLFRVLRAFLNQYFVLALSVVSYCVVGYLGLQADPRLVYNIDNALFYFVFFALGYVTFPMINRLFALDAPWKKMVFGLSGAVALIFSAMIYYRVDPLEVWAESKVGSLLVFAARAITISWFVCELSRLLEDAKFLRKIGEHTLYLCGNEYLVKLLVPYAVGIVGLSVQVESLVQVYLYVAALLVIGVQWMTPYEKKLVLVMQRGLDAGIGFVAKQWLKRRGKSMAEAEEPQRDKA